MNDIILRTKPTGTPKNKAVLIKEAKNDIKSYTKSACVHIYPDLTTILDDSYTLEELEYIVDRIKILKSKIEGLQ